MKKQYRIKTIRPIRRDGDGVAVEFETERGRRIVVMQTGWNRPGLYTCVVYANGTTRPVRHSDVKWEEVENLLKE